MNANILIVEDDKVCSKLFEKILCDEGYNVFSINDGSNIAKTIADYGIDVVLLDVVMPVVSGYDVLQNMQRQEDLRDIPVIIVTSLTAPYEVKRALEYGALDFIRKPCEPIELLARVNSALRLKKKQEMLIDMAKKDALTGLYNRWHFNRELEKCFCSGIGVSLIMFDCDYFKLINDKHGHSIGDEVLVSVAEVLKNSTRSTDIACRFGGDEMSLIMPGTTMMQACAVAERIRKNIAKLTFKCSGASFSLTISCGVGHSDQLGGKTARELTNAADEALYFAKENGRNRTEFYRDDMRKKHTETVVMEVAPDE